MESLNPYKKLLNKLRLPDFRPLMLFKSGKAQTLAAYLYPKTREIKQCRRHFVILPDGDQIALTENRLSTWLSHHRTLLLIHGLNGSHLSSYMIRIARLMVQQGYQVIRMDLRGCGAGRGKAKLPYHSGRSEDTRQVLHWLAKQYPKSPVTQIGFSLGANITLKMAGEDSSNSSGNLDSIIAVSPPLDLYASVTRMLQPDNRLFEQHFVKELLKDVKRRQIEYPYLNYPVLPKSLNLFEFDDQYTAPVCGFKNAMDYYQQCSSLQFMLRVKIPTLILHAEDDPVACNAAYKHLPTLDNIDVLITPQGGHVGWIGNTGNFRQYGFQWMDRVLVEWIKQKG